MLTRSQIPEVGGTGITIQLRLTDATDTTLTGFNSVAALSLPEDAGYFSLPAIPIRDGVATFEYYPGTRAGKHLLTADIPGVGKIPDILFSLIPGDPMYITHREESGNIIFSLRDRYGNISTDTSLRGTVKRNNETPSAVIFESGEYKTPKRSGYYIVHVPDLLSSKLTYEDSLGEHEIFGVPYYATYLAGTREQFDFLPDYNARYTVLA